MKSIYASKLYIASSRKGRIHAALLAPSNLSLVQQLAEDLDDVYQTPENLGQAEEKKEEGSESEGFDDFIVDEDIDPEKDLVTMKDFESISKGSSSHSAPSHSAAPSKAPKSEDSGGESKEPKGESKVDTSDLMPDSPATEEKPKPAEASTEVNDSATDINAATTVVKLEKLIDINTIKNTLNSRQDTAGVERMAEKENELWIYYNDDINLNNIMSEVIELLLTEGYEMFEFNRLARSDNAIVFVKTISTQLDPKSIESENAGK